MRTRPADAETSAAPGTLRFAGGRLAMDPPVSQETLLEWQRRASVVVLDQVSPPSDAVVPEGTLRVLIVDDDENDVRMVAALLAGLDVEVADDLRVAIGMAERDPERVILLDLRMPGCDGVESVRLMRAAAPLNPIVVLTGFSNEEIGLEAIAHGAQDFLRKDQIGREVLVRAIRFAIQRASRAQDLERRMLDDPLTGLPNRRLIRDRLQHALDRLDRSLETTVAVLFLDLDGFKAVNDRYGHEAGDRVLVAVAERLRKAMRSVDSIGRHGGDEFVVICEGLRDGSQLVVVAERISMALSPPVVYEGIDLCIRASIGAVFADRASTVDGLLRSADVAMYTAKRHLLTET